MSIMTGLPNFKPTLLYSLEYFCEFNRQPPVRTFTTQMLNPTADYPYTRELVDYIRAMLNMTVKPTRPLILYQDYTQDEADEFNARVNALKGGWQLTWRLYRFRNKPFKGLLAIEKPFDRLSYVYKIFAYFWYKMETMFKKANLQNVIFMKEVINNPFKFSDYMSDFAFNKDVQTLFRFDETGRIVMSSPNKDYVFPNVEFFRETNNYVMLTFDGWEEEDRTRSYVIDTPYVS